MKIFKFQLQRNEKKLCIIRFIKKLYWLLFLLEILSLLFKKIEIINKTNNESVNFQRKFLLKFNFKKGYFFVAFLIFRVK